MNVASRGHGAAESPASESQLKKRFVPRPRCAACAWQVSAKEAARAANDWHISSAARFAYAAASSVVDPACRSAAYLGLVELS